MSYFNRCDRCDDVINDETMPVKSVWERVEYQFCSMDCRREARRLRKLGHYDFENWEFTSPWEREISGIIRKF